MRGPLRTRSIRSRPEPEALALHRTVGGAIPPDLGSALNQLTTALDDSGMGIRYYAYAFDEELTQRALDDPFSILSSDPLADAGGLEPHSAVSAASFRQVPPERDMLYLDKAWGSLQDLTSSSSDRGARPCHRMFEGKVTMVEMGWRPWVRTIVPADVAAICEDLCAIDEPHVDEWIRRWRGPGDPDAEAAYVLEYLVRAQTFVTALAEDGRGMVYEIG